MSFAIDCNRSQLQSVYTDLQRTENQYLPSRHLGVISRAPTLQNNITLEQAEQPFALVVTNVDRLQIAQISWYVVARLDI